MKKLLALFLACLILTGCTGADGDATESTAPSTEEVRAGIYDNASSIELQTAGAVRQFRPGGTDYTTVTAMGSQLLLISGSGKSQLALYTGEDCIAGAAVTLDVDLSQTVWQVTDTGLLYYDTETKEAVWLDVSLQETLRVKLSEEIVGNPAFSPDCKEVFFCQGQEIRSLDLWEGISRLIRSHTCASQTLLGCWFDGSVILCEISAENGQTSRLYISTEDGSTLSEEPGILELETFEDRYYAYRMDGTVEQHLSGTVSGTASAFNIPGTTVPALALGVIVGITDGDTGKTFTCYDAGTGLETAAVTIPGIEMPASLYADQRASCLWILTKDGTLLSWDISQSPVTGEVAYTGPLYTATAPDTEGLALLQERVDQLNKQHGITIRIWEDAVKTPGKYTMTAEYQVSAITETLDRLEPLLTQFPENFLNRATSSRIRICIVRNVNSDETSVRYWDDGDGYIILPCGSDIENNFLLSMGYFIDSHVLGNTSMADSWSQLNPEGFVYGQEGEPGDCFPTAQAMVSVTDDRAHVFWQAMLPGNEALFASETMQAKLLLLCRSIRDAWNLERKTETYLWEQYLNEPIAYKK